jgi:hypothetical protein
MDYTIMQPICWTGAENILTVCLSCVYAVIVSNQRLGWIGWWVVFVDGIGFGGVYCFCQRMTGNQMGMTGASKLQNSRHWSS